MVTVLALAPSSAQALANSDGHGTHAPGPGLLSAVVGRTFVRRGRR